jgi:hypothetical protein
VGEGGRPPGGSSLARGRSLVWILAAFYGAMGAAVLASLGILVGGLYLLLGISVIARGQAVVAASGVLVGFGSMWWLLIAFRLVSGIRPNDSPLEGWAILATGAMLGGAALGYRAARRAA